MILSLLLAGLCSAQAVQEDQILQKADKLLEEAKAGYEAAREKGSTSMYIDAGFKLEEARIKYFVLQEIGSPEKQKLAAERLRSVNQLSKLLHESKLASGSSSDAPAPRPAEPSPAEPKAPLVAPKIDVLKRAPVPDLVRQREAEKQIKELFKEQYVKKTPADREALAIQLLEMASKSMEDHAALWVLCREAQDVASQNGSARVALDAAEIAARVFDVDGLALRNTVLTAVGRSVKTADDFAELTESMVALAEEHVRSDQWDAADRAVTAALVHARKAQDPPMADRVAMRGKEIAEAKSLFAAMKSVLETLARTPEDPAANAEMGKFLCYVKGSWDLGLRFMLKGNDPVLKAMAEKEATLPTASADRIALGDGWFDLADKERSPLRKNQMLAHAQAHYEAGLPGATPLVQARVAKRQESLQNVARAPGQSVRSTAIDITTLAAKKVSVGNGELAVNQKTISVFGKDCNRYLYPHAPSTVVYDIPAGTRAFTAVGTRENKNEPKVLGSWRYLVVVDGKTLYQSPPLSEVKGGELLISVTIPLGAKEIQLKVDEMGQNFWDWSAWAWPRFLK